MLFPRTAALRAPDDGARERLGDAYDVERAGDAGLTLESPPTPASREARMNSVLRNYT
jgi:hypothetical protein